MLGVREGVHDPLDFEEIEKRRDPEIDNLLIFPESITALSVEYGTPAIGQKIMDLDLNVFHLK